MWWSPLTSSGERERVLEGLLRVGVAGCFIGHGAFGIIGKSAWLPYFAVLGISEGVAGVLMPIVGTVDILVGIITLVSPRPVVLAYATFWGLWTALLRPLAGESVFETLERAGNYGVPLALLLLAAVRFEWSRQWLRPLAIDRLTWDRDRLLFRVLQVTTAALLLGHGGLALGGKPLLIGHLEAVGLPAAWITSLGAAEVVLALAVLVRPFPGLLLFVFTWKVSTEVLFPVTGAPLWEFIERAGSYVAPLALWTLASRPLSERSPDRKLHRGAVAGVLTAVALGAAPANPVQALGVQAAPGGADAPVLAALRGGGHVLACRHGITDRRRGDARRVDFDDPSTQRVLSVEGRRQAEQIGERVRGLGVPIGDVFASPYARASETARLAFGQFEVRDPLRSRRPRDEAALPPLFHDPPAAGTNRVLVTHQWVLYPMLPDVEAGSIREGDCLVLRPETPGRGRVVARLGLDEWRRLGALPAGRPGGDRIQSAEQGPSPLRTARALGRDVQEAPALAAAVAGGVTVVCRHAVTRRFREVEPVDYADASTQRLLSAEGEDQSVAMGRHMRSRGVRVAELVASPMRRAIRTAELLFPDVPVAIEGDWHTNGGSYGGPPLERRRRVLSSAVEEGTRVIVSHIGTIASVVPEARGRMEEGDCVVARPAAGSFEVVGFVPWRAWEPSATRPGAHGWGPRGWSGGPVAGWRPRTPQARAG